MVDLERFSWVKEIAGAVAARFIRGRSANLARRTRPRRRSAPPPRSKPSSWGVAATPHAAGTVALPQWNAACDCTLSSTRHCKGAAAALTRRHTVRCSMKRSLLLLCMSALALVACSKQQSTSPGPADSSTTAPAAPADSPATTPPADQSSPSTTPPPDSSGSATPPPADSSTPPK